MPRQRHLQPQGTQDILHPHHSSNTHQYMARLCFGAHTLRLQAAGITGYTSHAEEDYRQDLTAMFAHAHFKGFFRPGTAARHVIPRLASITPRSNKDKAALVDDFTKHYDTVQSDLLFIQDIVTVDRQLDLDSIASIRNCLAGLHMTLVKGVKWRTIMPYTPLPKACLPMLRNFINRPKHCHLIGDLTHSVVDVESWLSLPPPCIEFSARLKASVMETLEQESDNNSIGETTARPSVQGNVETAAVTTPQEQGTEQIDLLREQIQQVQAERAQLIQRINTLELAASKQNAVNRLKEERWVAAASQLEREYCEHNAQQNTEIERLNVVLDDERARNANIEANVNQMLPEATVCLSTLVSVPSSGDSTTNGSFPAPQPSSSTPLRKSTSNHTNSQLHPLQQMTASPTSQGISMPAESRHGTSDIKQPIISDPSSSLVPNLPNVGHPNPFLNYMAGDTGVQTHPNSNKVFKETCRNFKLGKCTRGEKCRFPHRACRHWLDGDCKHGENCHKSHDPFFLEQSNPQPQSHQRSHADQMIIDTDPYQGLNSQSQEHQTNSIQPTMRTECAPSSVPSGPKAWSRHSAKKHRKTATPTSHDYVSNFQSDGHLNSHLGAPSDLGQWSYQLRQTKKQACYSHLNGRCNRAQNCKYAHEPCAHFIRGACKFTDEICNNSHDPLFLKQATSGKSSQDVSPQHQNPPQSQMNVQRRIGDIIWATGQAKSSGVVPRPNVPCIWQKSPAGCTNARCGYKHDLPKATVEQE
jgi:hypothetical protein